jgi:hypothetical protein
MNSGAGDTTQLVPGYPIRTPWDHSSVDNSPRPIAASHVLHRLLMPRHPPSALDNLTTKILASTMHNSTNNQPAPQQPHPTPTPNTGTRTRPRNPTRGAPGTETTTQPGCSLRTQQDACTAAAQPDRTTRSAPPPTEGVAVLEPPSRRRPPTPPVSPPTSTPDPTSADRGAPYHPRRGRMVLLRKEVIQPHLPVRLPCYDFVPIASPTFDRSPPSGLGHGLRVLPTFVT